LTEEIFFCMEHPYEENDEEKLRRARGAMEEQHMKIINAQRDVILSTAKPNKFIAVSSLARHEPSPSVADGGRRHKVTSDDKALGSPSRPKDSAAALLGDSSQSSESTVTSSRPTNVTTADESKVTDASSTAAQGDLTQPLTVNSSTLVITKVPATKRPISETEYLRELYSGISGTPGASATGDVWGRDSLSDVIRLVLRQKHRQRRRDEEELQRKSGLKLLQSSGDMGFFFQESRKAESQRTVSKPHSEIFSGHQEQHQQTQQQAQTAQRILRAVGELKGVSKLRFVKMKQLTAIAREHFAMESAQQDEEAGNSASGEVQNSNVTGKTDAGKGGATVLADGNEVNMHATPGLPSHKKKSASGKSKSGKSVKFSSKQRAKSVRFEPHTAPSAKPPSVSQKSTKITFSLSSKMEYEQVMAEAAAEQQQEPHFPHHYHLDDEPADYDDVDEDELDDEADNAAMKTAVKSKKSPIHELDLPERVITTLSTKSNMKYMSVGNNGLKHLSLALDGDINIQNLCLSNARISCSGLTAFAAHFENMRGLTYLDLSQNGISDAGVTALAHAITGAADTKMVNVKDALSVESVMKPKHPLRRLILSGNRITIVGAAVIVGVLLNTKTLLRSVHLSCNKIAVADRAKLSEDGRQYNSGAVARHAAEVRALLLEEAKAKKLERQRLADLAAEAAFEAEEARRRAKPSSLSARIAATSARVINVVANSAMSSRRQRSDSEESQKESWSKRIIGSWKKASPSSRDRSNSPDRVAKAGLDNPSSAGAHEPFELDADADIFNQESSNCPDYGVIAEQDIPEEAVVKYDLKFLYL
jgi:hypothetical protein